MSKLLVPLLQQFTKRQKYAFYKIKTDFLIKYGLLNPQFINSISGNTQGASASKTPPKQSSKTPEKQAIKPLTIMMKE